MTSTVAGKEEITERKYLSCESLTIFLSHICSDVVVGVQNTLMTALDIRDGKFLGHLVYPLRLIKDYGFLFILWADFHHKVVAEDLGLGEMFSKSRAK